MEEWVEKEKQKRGEGKIYHYLASPDDFAFMADVWSWCEEVDWMGYRAGEMRETRRGKRPQRWGDREWWICQNLREIRRKAQEMGEGRVMSRRVEDVGFFLDELRADI